MDERKFSHDASAAVAKLKTIFALMRESSLEEIREEFLPMAESCVAELKKLLDERR